MTSFGPLSDLFGGLSDLHLVNQKVIDVQQPSDETPSTEAPFDFRHRFLSVQTSDEATAAQIQLLAALFGAIAMKREWWQILPNKKASYFCQIIESPVCRISCFFRIRSRKDFKPIR